MNDQTEQPSNSLTKFDDARLKGIVPAAPGVQRAVFLPANFAEALEMSKLMASGIGVRDWCRGNVSACMMIVQQAMRWGMDPYAVANKSYFASDQVSYESQLVNAVVNTSGEILGRLKVEFEGDTAGGKNKETLVCKVSGRLRADPDEVKELDQALATITIRNSPLWSVNAKLQLAYHTTRSWARLYAPEALLGIYTPDELADGETIMIEANTRPATASAPDRRDFTEQEPEPVEDADFEPVSDENAEKPADDAETGADMQESRESVTNDAENDTPEPENKVEIDPVPTKEAEWAEWERDTRLAIDTAQDQKALSAIATRIASALAAAPKDMADRITEAMTDGFADLSGN